MIKASSIRALLLLAFVIPLSAAAEDGDEISMRIAENSEAIAERTRTLLEHRLEEEVLRLPEQSDLDKSEARRPGAPRDTIGDRRGAEAPVRAAAAPPREPGLATRMLCEDTDPAALTCVARPACPVCPVNSGAGELLACNECVDRSARLF